MKRDRLFITLFALMTLVHANNNLEISTKLLEEVSQGSTKHLKDLNEAIPGNVIAYQHTIKNPTSMVAKDVVFSDKIPLHTTYVPNSATCNNECTIQYSVDGEVFEKASELFVYNRTLKLANPKKYRFIRWVFNELKPNSKIVILFKTKID
jgi:uncharacterized repeat protein (TIGR01451 family)